MTPLLRPWVVTVVACLAAQAMARAEEAGRALKLLQASRPLVIAHRGYSSAAPENTLAAFRFALQAEADLVELDYHHSRDGVLTVIHDGTVDRTTDAIRQTGRTNLAVADLAYADLARLDAGRWFGQGFADQRLPRLEEALEVIQAGGITLIERKAGEAAACVELLQQRQLVNQVVVQSFDWEYLEDFHRREPRQVLGALGPWGSYRGTKLTDDDKWLSPRWIDEAGRVGARVVVWNRQVKRPAIEHAHARGLKVWVYTIDDPAVANELLDTGVDGLITNNPGRLWRVLAQRGR